MPGLPCDVPNLFELLQKLLGQVPRRRVTTYGDLAEALGSRVAARWVGEFMLDHPHDDQCTCHRVLRHTGEPGLYISGDECDKPRRLLEQTITVLEGRVDLNEYRFNGFKSEKPLAKLAAFQQTVPEYVSLKPFPKTPELVAGVDVSYVWVTLQPSEITR